jgi:hypothetical protein
LGQGAALTQAQQTLAQNPAATPAQIDALRREIEWVKIGRDEYNSNHFLEWWEREVNNASAARQISVLEQRIKALQDQSSYNAALQQQVATQSAQYNTELERQRQIIRDLGGTPAFATGGAFTNSIVQRPTAFNMGVMGEAGPEAIMPLSNVGGSLGIRAQMPGTQGMLQALQTMQALMQRLQSASENGALTSQEQLHLWRRLTRAGRSMPVAPSPNDPLTVEVLP